MKSKSKLAMFATAVGASLSLVGASYAGSLFGFKLPGGTPTGNAAAGTYGCNTDAATLAGVAGVEPDSGGKILTVCINDFIYQPPVVTPRVGDVVCWVNVEQCADPSGGPINIVEGLAANVLGIGCDTHHEVVTVPDEMSFDSADTLNARICSRFPSIAANPALPAIPGFGIDAGSCPGHPIPAGDEVPSLPGLVPAGEPLVTNTNVFCHKFENVGLQHYTCLTNPAHAAVLNGGILVLPKDAPALPELPQTPAL